MRPLPRRRTTPLVAMLALGLAVSACGSSTGDTDTAAAGSDRPTTTAPTASGGDGTTTSGDTATSAAAPSSNFPAVEVVDLGSGSKVDFATAVSGGSLPTLIWFWAPH